MPARAEQNIETHNVKIEQLPARVNVEGPHGPLAGMDFYPPQITEAKRPWPSGRIPSTHEFLPVLSREDMRFLTLYEHIVGAELSERTGLEYALQDENSSRNTLNSERAYFQKIKAKQAEESEFEISTKVMLKREIKVGELQDRVRRSSLRMGEGMKMGEVDETLQHEVEKMQEDIEFISQGGKLSER